MYNVINSIKNYWNKRKVSCIKCGKKYSIYKDYEEKNDEYNLHLCSSHCFFDYYTAKTNN